MSAKGVALLVAFSKHWAGCVIEELVRVRGAGDDFRETGPNHEGPWVRGWSLSRHLIFTLGYI